MIYVNGHILMLPLRKRKEKLKKQEPPNNITDNMNQHHAPNYYLEYYEKLDEKLELFVQHWTTDKQVLLGQYCVKKPLLTYLFYRMAEEKDHYNLCRLEGMSVNDSMKRIDALLDSFREENHETESCQEEVLHNIKEHPWYELLSEYQGQLLIYIFNDRQLQYLVPLLQKQDCPVLLLSEQDIPDDTDFPESVMALTLDFSSEKVFIDKTFQRTFPLVFHYANTFDILLQILQPCDVICLEDRHFQEQLLAAMAKAYRRDKI